MQPSTRLAQAEALMAERRFAEAIVAFDLHLADEPQDLRALLKLGICHLLNRSRGAFLEAHRRAEQAVARMGTLPTDVSQLYELYRGLLVRVGAATVVAGALVLTPGCTESKLADAGAAAAPAGEAADAGRTEHRPQHRYSGGVRLERQAPDERVAVPPPAPSQVRKKYGGGMRLNVPTDGK